MGGPLPAQTHEAGLQPARQA